MIKAWVLGVRTSENNYNNSQLLKAFRDRGVECAFYDLSKITNDPNSNVLIYEGNILEPPDLVILSNSILILYSSPLNQFYRITSIFKTWTNTVFVNNLDSHINASNKQYVYDTLINNNIPVPITETLPKYEESESELDAIKQHLIQKIGFPIVIKPTNGFHGENVFKCDDEETLNSNIESLRLEIAKRVEMPSKFYDLSHQPVEDQTFDTDISEEEKKAIAEAAQLNLIQKNKNIPIVMQEYMSESVGLMLGVRVIGNKIDARYHLGSPLMNDSFKSDISYGKLQLACEVDDKLREIVVNTMSVLNLDTARLDVFPTANGYKICEVNCLGNFYGLDTTNNLNQASEIVDLALSKLGV